MKSTFVFENHQINQKLRMCVINLKFVLKAQVSRSQSMLSCFAQNRKRFYVIILQIFRQLGLSQLKINHFVKSRKTFFFKEC